MRASHLQRHPASAAAAASGPPGGSVAAHPASTTAAAGAAPGVSVVSLLSLLQHSRSASRRPMVRRVQRRRRRLRALLRVPLSARTNPVHVRLRDDELLQLHNRVPCAPATSAAAFLAPAPAATPAAASRSTPAAAAAGAPAAAVRAALAAAAVAHSATAPALAATAPLVASATAAFDTAHTTAPAPVAPAHATTAVARLASLQGCRPPRRYAPHPSEWHLRRTRARGGGQSGRHATRRAAVPLWRVGGRRGVGCAPLGEPIGEASARGKAAGVGRGRRAVACRRAARAGGGWRWWSGLGPLSGGRMHIYEHLRSVRRRCGPPALRAGVGEKARRS